MTGPERASEQTRADALFRERYDANLRRTDRLFAYLMLGQWACAIALAAFLSPYAWAGKTHVVHAHVYMAVLLGGTITALPVLLAFQRPGWVVTRMVIASAQMMWSVLLIHLTGGRIETHFHIFGSLAFLAFYRDWRVLIPATVIVAVEHLTLQMYWPESIYGILAPESWRFLEHAFWVVFEDIFLMLSCIASVQEMKSLAAQQARIEVTDRLEREMEIATHIQTSILPRHIDVEGLQAAAAMHPTAEVGGDYYEVLPVPGGCWIAIGDVAGHGLKAGLVMLQTQSAVEALVSGHPDGSPSKILRSVNRVLFENVRKRLGSDEYVTMSLLRYYDDGRIICAGAHEEAIIWRAATGRCERIPVTGTWLGAIEDVGAANVETTYTLANGDLLVLYSDGLSEARSPAGEQFGLDRLCEGIEASCRASVDHIRDHLLDVSARWAAGRQDDDVTLMVFRQVGVAQKAAA